MDRCESCHLGTREPVVLTRRRWAARRCSPAIPTRNCSRSTIPRSSAARPATAATAWRCRASRRRTATTSTGCGRCTTRRTSRPGCQQCHAKEIVTEKADTLNAGPRDFPAARLHGLPPLRGFRPRGGRDLVGQPADPPAGAAEGGVAARGRLRRSRRATSTRSSTPKRSSFTHEANDLKVRSSGLDAKIEQLDMRARSLVREVKKVGPSLKEVRDEAAQGVDSGVAEGSARLARRHQDADLPAGR